MSASPIEYLSPSDDSTTLYGYVDAQGDVFLEPGDTPLPEPPLSVVPLEPNRRFVAMLSGGTLIILGHVGGSTVLTKPVENTPPERWATEQEPDFVAPQKPVEPTLTPFAGGLHFTWNGKAVDGQPWPGDYKHAEFHLSEDGAFVPNGDSFIVLSSSQMGGSISIPGLTAGTTYFARVVCVDDSGNRSPASDVASGTPTQLVADAIDQALQDAIEQASADAAASLEQVSLQEAALKGLVKASESDPGHYEGRIWWQLDAEGRCIGIKVSDGSTWTPYTLVADQLLVPGSVTAGTIGSNEIYAKVMATGELKADALRTGALAADVSVKAGDPDGYHAELSSSGFKSYAPNPEGEGAPVEVVRLGTGEDDALVLTNSSGRTVAAIREDGSAQFEKRVTVGSLTVGGRDVFDLVQDTGRGVVGYGFAKGDRQLSTGSQQLFFLHGVPVVRGRMYKLTFNPMVFAEASGTFNFRLWAREPPRASATLRTYMSHTVTTGYMGYSIPQMITFIKPNLSGALDWNVDGDFTAGGAGKVIGAQTWLMVEDIGPALPDTVWQTRVTTQNYTSEWVASQSGTYRGDGSLRGDVSNQLRQGYVGQSNGDQHGIALFTDGAVSGESGKTIASAIGGATISRVEVFLYANHWYWSGGGTAMISAHGHTSMTNQTPDTAKVHSTGWPKPGGRWVDITSIWDTGKRGIWVGKTGSSSLTNYGWFDGAGSGNPPRLRISYTR